MMLLLCLQVSLNEGCHQLRLYQAGPDGTGPLYNNCLRDTGIRYVPCASILVRLYKAPVGPQGTILKVLLRVCVCMCVCFVKITNCNYI